MEILEIGRSAFYKLLQTSELKGFKEKNRYKIPVESIEEYVDNGLAILEPISCTSIHNDTRWDVDLVHPIDEWGKWKRL